jgi:hypothetical protein
VEDCTLHVQPDEPAAAKLSLSCLVCILQRYGNGLTQARSPPCAHRGGHRRFAESDVRALLEPKPLQSSGVQRLVQSALGRNRLQVSEGKLSEQSWYQRFDEMDKAEHRELGRQLLSMVMHYLTQSSDREEILQEARSLGRSYGEHSLVNKLTLTESVRAFLYFHDFPADGIIQMSDTMGQKVSIDLINTSPPLDNKIESIPMGRDTRKLPLQVICTLRQRDSVSVGSVARV